MKLTAICDVCKKAYELNNSDTPVYQMFLRDLRYSETREPRLICEKCLTGLFSYSEKDLEQEKKGAKTDEPSFEPTSTPVLASTPERNRFYSVPLRKFLNTEYYKNTLKKVEFYDSEINEIFNFNRYLDYNIEKVTETKDSVQVILQKR